MNFFLCDKYKLAGAMVLKNAHTSVIHVLNKHCLEEHYWRQNVKKIWAVPDDYRIFAFVRNPYSRIFSAYRIFYKKYYELSFIKFMITALPILIISNKHFWPFKRYLRFLPDRTELYRFEEFEENFKYVLESAGINETKIPHANPPRPDFEHLKYQDQYNKLTKVIIEREYKWDLENLNYSFDSYGELPTIGELKKTINDDI